MKKIFCFLSESCDKKGNIYGKSRLFPSRNSASTTCFARSRGAQFEHMKLYSNLVKYKSLSLHEVNKPSTESL